VGDAMNVDHRVRERLSSFRMRRGVEDDRLIVTCIRSRLS